MKSLFEISGLNIYLQLAVTLISIAAHLFFTRNRNHKETTIELVAIYTFGLAGWFSIINGILGHLIFADSVANSIGWPLNSGFQSELAFASIGIGLIGFIGFWIKSFWLPFIIAKSSFMIGAGMTHIFHIFSADNYATGNAGIVLYWDFLLPIAMILIYLSYLKDQKKHE